MQYFFLRIMFVVCSTNLFSGFWDWFQIPPKNEKIDFCCPYHCGEWGTSSIQSLEWDFVQCLYNAHEMMNYIEKNLISRSEQYPYRVKFSGDYVPEEFPFRYERPEDFTSKWYQKVLDQNELYFVSVSECKPRTYGCEGCKTALWKILHFDDETGFHLGKHFVRILDSENFDYYYQSNAGDDDVRPYSNRVEGKNEYSFGNFIDFHHACLGLEDDLAMVKNANWCLGYKYSPFFEEQILSRFTQVSQSVISVKAKHHNIFAHCAKDHRAPSAFYNLALEQLALGKYEEGLEYFKSLFANVKHDSIPGNLASEIYLSKGRMEVEIAFYDDAILSLGKVLEVDSNNKDAYLERAIAYFEKGEFDLSLKDYFDGGKDARLFPFVEDPFLRDYGIGILTGATKGIAEATVEFLPSICSSLRGAGNLLWATVNHPIDSPKQFAAATIEFFKYLRSCDRAELAKILVPEMYELIVQWDRLSAVKRGELMGYTMAKYSTEILLPIAVIKGAKYVKTYNEIKKAEKLFTIKTLSKSPESKEALSQATVNWQNQRKALFEKIQLESEKQNKHIKGKHNFIEGNSEWTHPNPEAKLKELAGKGQKIRGEPGHAGFKERVDCGEIIGNFVNDETKEILPTTMATIHYSKKGAHLVPAAPKKQ